jgi:transformation/transcription domain-associated protein
MKVIIDLHGTYSRPPPPSSAQPANAEPTPDPTVSQIEASVDEFLEIVADLFKNMGSVVEETFREAARQTRSQAGQAAADAQSPSSGGPPSLEGEGGSGNQPVVYAPAMRSFKLLQDCPASIVFIFQTYRPLVNKAITIFVPLVFEVSVTAAPPRVLHLRFSRCAVHPDAGGAAAAETRVDGARQVVGRHLSRDPEGQAWRFPGHGHGAVEGESLACVCQTAPG